MSSFDDLPMGLSSLDYVTLDAFAITGGTCMERDCAMPLFSGGHFRGGIVFSRSSLRGRDLSGASWQDAVFLCPEHLARRPEPQDDEVAELRERRRMELTLALTEAVAGRRRSSEPESFYPHFPELLQYLEERTQRPAAEIILALRQTAATLLRVDRDARRVYAAVVESGFRGRSGIEEIAISIPVLQARDSDLDDWLLLPGLQGLHHEGIATVYWQGYPSGLDGASRDPHLAVKAPIDYLLPLQAWYGSKGIALDQVFV